MGDWPKETCSGRPPEQGHEGSPAPAPVGADGQHGDHWVLSESERAAGHVRPVRAVYFHEKCGQPTRMPQKIAETYAREPSFYGRTFCCFCKAYLPVGEGGEFVWADEKGARTSLKVGT